MKTHAAAQSAIDKIHAFRRFGSVLGLERMSELAKRLGNPEKKLACIHVAGTNGKGSVCRFLYGALRANGYRTGIYTSPYLTVFNERIELDGSYISGEDLSALTDEVLEKVAEMVADGFDSPTEFEVITAVAFLYFARKKCDFAIMEVGLGGRGDSTNILEEPLAAVITSISYDHMDRLGNTLAEIAREKAGIIKAGVPTVINECPEEAAKEIARTAYRKGAPLYDVSRLACRNVRSDLHGSVFDAFIGEKVFSDLRISMPGGHQVTNAMTALATLELLRKRGAVQLEKEALYRGFAEAKNIGRFEIVREGAPDAGVPTVILDGAHNEAGAEALEKTLSALFAGKRILAVTGILKDKAADRIIDRLCGVCDAFIATEPGNERRLPAESLAALIRARGKECRVEKEPARAAEAALACGRDFDVVLFAGSLYLIGEIRGLLVPPRA